MSNKSQKVVLAPQSTDLVYKMKDSNISLATKICRLFYLLKSSTKLTIPEYYNYMKHMKKPFYRDGGKMFCWFC